MINVRKLTGQSVGNYQLRELYGAGGMGAVYRAHQVNLERDVAFKVMNLHYSDDPEFVKRFQREAKLAASLEHPNIVPIHDYGTFDGILYVVMRLLTGGSLSERLLQRQGKRPSPGEAAVILKQLASALDYAHSKGIIHRDVKSGNVMFDSHGTAYLVDFGIARLLQDTSTRLTADGTTVGTPTHMAPEQWLGEDPTPAADQYALAVVVYELITGRLPFNAPTPYALMSQHLNQMPPPLQTLVPALPDELSQVVGRALAKDRKKRYPTATAFAQAFEEAAARLPARSTGMSTFELRRDLLHTDVVAEMPQIEQTIAQPGQATLPVSEQDILQSRVQAAPKKAHPIQPVPQRQPTQVQNFAPQPNAARLQPVPAAPGLPSVPSRQKAVQPLRPVLTPDMQVITGSEKAKNDDRLASNAAGGISGGVFGLLRRVFKLLLALIGLILKQALKSTISFIVTLLLTILLLAIAGTVMVAMLNHNGDMGLALREISGFFGEMFGSVRLR